MKFIFIILFIFFSNSAFANEYNNDEVEVINLHESKSLDQLVLENLNVEEENEEFVESLKETETNTVEVKQIEIVSDNFISKNEVKTINNYLQNLQKITSKTLQKATATMHYKALSTKAVMC